MKYLYLIYENANREILGKILMATKALKHDWKIVIGQKNSLRPKLKHYPPGIILEKGMRKGMNKFTTEWKKKGHIVCMCDEEAITYSTNQNYFQRNLDKNITKSVDYFFAIGPRHFNTLSKKIDKKKIIKLGNVKYDLYKKKYRNIFDKDVKKINKTNKNFILITSRFGNVNEHVGRQASSIKNKFYQFMSKILFNEFLELPDFLIKNQSKYKRVIVRPHPSENLETWIKHIKDEKNCEVILRNNVATWILASSIVIQNRCTTGIEAYLLGKKVISFKDNEKKDEISKIFKNISIVVKNKKELISSILKKKKSEKKDSVNKILYNYKSRQQDSSSKLIKLLNNLYKKNKTHLNVDQKITVEKMNKFSIFNLKNLIKKNNYNSYLKQKNGDTNLFNYENYFRYFAKKFFFLKEYQIKKISKEIYIIQNQN